MDRSLPPEQLLHDVIQRLIVLLLARGIVRVWRGGIVWRGRRRRIVAARRVQSLLNQIAQGVAERVAAARIARAAASVIARRKQAAAHFLELQFCDSGFSRGPVDGHHGVGIAAYDRLQRHLDSQVELRGDQGLHAFNHIPTIHLESVGNVVVRQPENDLDEPGAQTDQLAYMKYVCDDKSAVAGKNQIIGAGQGIREI